MTIKKFNKSSALVFRRSVAAALSDLVEREGLQLEFNPVQYTDDMVKMKLTFTVVRDVNDREKVRRNEFVRNADMILFSRQGFLPSHYGSEFYFDSKLYRLIGLEVSRPKNCCRVERVSDPSHVGLLPADVVLRGIGVEVGKRLSIETFRGAAE